MKNLAEIKEVNFKTRLYSNIFKIDSFYPFLSILVFICLTLINRYASIIGLLFLLNDLRGRYKESILYITSIELIENQYIIKYLIKDIKHDYKIDIQDFKTALSNSNIGLNQGASLIIYEKNIIKFRQYVVGDWLYSTIVYLANIKPDNKDGYY